METQKNAEYELGRYKKKVEDQQQEIQRLKADAEGYRQLQDISAAYIALLLRRLKAGEDNPIRLENSAVKAAMERFRVLAKREDEEGFSLWVKEISDK